MCRLMGAVLFDGYEDVRDYDVIQRKLVNLLTVGERAQGGDGNGIAILKKDDSVNVYKSPLRATQDLKNVELAMSPEVLSGAKYVMLHTRLSTHGESRFQCNLHPFVFSDIVGAHNGVVWGYDSLWAKFGRVIGTPASENDSEVIFALLNELSPDLELTGIQDALSTITDGSLAITAFSRKNTDQVLLVSRENPLSFYHDEANGILWYASTSMILMDAGVTTSYSQSTSMTDEGMLVSISEKKWSRFALETVSRSRYYYTAGFEDYYPSKKKEDVESAFATNGGWGDFDSLDISEDVGMSMVYTCEFCKDMGVLTEHEYLRNFGYDFMGQTWFEDDRGETVCPCPNCVKTPSM